MTAVVIADCRTGQDVITFLIAQHDQIKSLLQQISDADGGAREQAFGALRRLLAGHETAEDEVVHPRAKLSIADGENIIDARLEEENEAKRQLGRLANLEVESADFDRLFQQLDAISCLTPTPTPKSRKTSAGCCRR